MSVKIITVDPNVARSIPFATARELKALPLRYESGRLFVAMVNPSDDQTKEQLGFLVGEFSTYPAEWIEIENAIHMLEANSGTEINIPIHFLLGSLLLEKHLITAEQLERGLAIQQNEGGKLGQILVGLGFLNRLILSEVLAEQLGLKHINLRQELPRADVVKMLSPEDARRLGAVPISFENNKIRVAIADPTDYAAQNEIRQLLPYSIEFAVTSSFDIDWILRRVHSDTYMKESVWGLFYRRPEESAYETFSTPQLAFVIAALLALVGGLWFAPIPVMLGINAVFAFMYFVTSIFRLFLAYRSTALDSSISFSDEQINSIKDIDLPIYTLLVPVFKERQVLPRLIQHIQDLDYPKNKLDVKLLLEETDTETLDAAKNAHPPGYFEFVIVPDAVPRTKPKACNYGLLGARGKYLVIYDAEDRPDPDQLKKAVLAFENGGEQLVCVQAKLNYFNRNQNMLTRWFTCEYSNWFDLVLPGLDKLDLPIPLGGTSNHFVTEKLRELGGWDPFNVTEDADLGIRMYKHRFTTAVLDSTTYEEANSALWNWIRQRTRWIKGYLQTWLVNMRNPWVLLKELGIRGFLGFHLIVGGTPFMLLLNPFFWGMTSLWFITRLTTINVLFPPVIYFISAFNLLIGNFSFVYLNVISTFRRTYYELGRFALFVPFYWALMSLASWRAFWQLMTKPFYWEKTVHGLDKPEAKTTR